MASPLPAVLPVMLRVPDAPALPPPPPASPDPTPVLLSPPGPLAPLPTVAAPAGVIAVYVIAGLSWDVAAALVLGFSAASEARITTISVEKTTPFADGMSFGEAGSYVRMTGIAKGERQDA